MMLPFVIYNKNLFKKVIPGFLSSFIAIILILGIVYIFVNSSKYLSDNVSNVLAIISIILIFYLFEVVSSGNTFLKESKIVFLDIVFWDKKVVYIDQIDKVFFQNNKEFRVKMKNGIDYVFKPKIGGGFIVATKQKHYEKFFRYFYSKGIAIN